MTTAITGENSLTKMLDMGFRRRMPMIFQSEMVECGLACIAMVSSYHGHRMDMTTIRSKFEVSSNGANLSQLMQVAMALNLTSRPLRLNMCDLKQLQTPCILHWDMNHFVVLSRVKGNKITIHDPAFGIKEITYEEASPHFTGVALELLPTQEFTASNEIKKLKLSQFWTKITGLKTSITQIVFLSLLLQFIAVASPIYMQTIIDDVLLRNDVNLLVVLAIGFGMLLVLETFISALREHVTLYISSRVNIQMGSNLFNHLLSLPVSYFTKRHMGDINSRFGSLSNIRDLLTSQITMALVDGLMSIIVIAIMLVYSVKLTIIVLCVMAVYLLIRIALYRPLRQRTQENIIASARQETNFMETIRAIQSIKLFQKENHRKSMWQNHFADTINTGIKVGMLGIGFGVINQVLFGLENIIVIYLAANEVIAGAMSVGMMIAFMSYRGRVADSLQRLIENYIEFKMIGLHLERLSDITSTQKEDTPESINFTKIDVQDCSNLVVQDLSYQYSESEPFVFQSVNFCVGGGESVVITGPSGCGKTTLLKCMMGIVKKYDGDILYDDADISKIPEYRNIIAAVMQDDCLVSGSIRDNIAFYDDKIDNDWVEHCARIACIHDEIIRMPMRYNTLVGDMGSSLSGGQKQRILLARALYRKPKILFLDEATSHLDVETEKRINHHVNELKITRIQVAHRIETIRSASREISLVRSPLSL